MSIKLKKYASFYSRSKEICCATSTKKRELSRFAPCQRSRRFKCGIKFPFDGKTMVTKSSFRTYILFCNCLSIRIYYIRFCSRQTLAHAGSIYIYTHLCANQQQPLKIFVLLPTRARCAEYAASLLQRREWPLRAGDVNHAMTLMNRGKKSVCILLTVRAARVRNTRAADNCITRARIRWTGRGVYGRGCV